jgi:hypothetical protein
MLTDDTMREIDITTADTNELNGFLEGFLSHLFNFFSNARKLALDFFNLSHELIRLECNFTFFAISIALFQPLQRLTKFSLTIRTDNFVQLFAELTHELPLAGMVVKALNIIMNALPALKETSGQPKFNKAFQEY